MKKLVLYSLLVASATVIGATAGVVGKRVLGSEELDYGNLDVTSMKPDCDAIYKKVASYNGVRDVTDSFSASDIINYSLEKYRRCENSYSFCFGLADTIVKQDIRSAQIKNGNNYFEESISKSSVVALGNRMFEKNKGGDIDLYFGDSKSVTIGDSVTTVSYDANNHKVFKGDEYASIYGKRLDEMFIYLVCENTVLDSKITKNNGYVISLDLDPIVASYFYQLQMKNISNLDKLPVFSSINLTFTLDGDLTLRHLSVDENYTATIMVDAKTHGTLEYYFYPDQYLEIPGLNEALTYRKGD